MKNKVGFGGGCHWCTEAVFQSLRGVTEVQQGWISSEKNEVSFSEAVVVYFDPNLISLMTLIEIHLLTHESTSSHSMRGKYRSAIYYTDEEQQNVVRTILINLQLSTPKPYITKILALIEFKSNEDQFLNYYKTRPEAPFCQTYISPKLSKIRKQFAKQMNT